MIAAPAAMRDRLAGRLLALILPVALLAAGCRAPDGSVDGAGRSADVRAERARRAIRATLDELYAAFCFDPGAEPDWETQRRIYLEGAVFVPSIRPDRPPAGDDTERFLADFRAFARSESFRDTGFHERIVGTRIEVFGGVAHAFVAFEGFAPGDGETQTVGLDSLQLVFDGERWRLVSFTTQFEREGLPLPARFRDS